MVNDRLAGQPKRKDSSRARSVLSEARLLCHAFIFVLTATLVGNIMLITKMIANLHLDEKSDAAYSVGVSIIDYEIILLVFCILAAAFFLYSGIARKYEKSSLIWEYVATRDPMTGLANRAAFIQALDETLEESTGKKQQSAILFIDLNKFKHINDTYGHAVGDLVLIATSKRIFQAVTSKDVAARLGGDEFAVLLTNIQAGPAAKLVAQLDSALREPIQLGGGSQLQASASIGMRMTTSSDRNAEEILHDADVAMYQTKAVEHARVGKAQQPAR